MNKIAKIYVSGHRGLVGSAVVKKLQAQGYTNLVLRTQAELDLTDQPATEAFFAAEQPDYVFLAAAKVGGIEMSWSYNRQYGTKYLAVMPTNLYGLGDNYHPENSHVIPAMIRRFHEAKLAKAPTLTVWGTGTPRREFLYSEDMADACVFLMNLSDEKYDSLLGSDEAKTGRFEPPLVNIGVGEDVTIRELAETVKQVVGYEGEIVFDTTKPDGTPRKLMDVGRLNILGWSASTSLQLGLKNAYLNFRAE